MIILQRQARDKHIGKTQKEDRFLKEPCGVARDDPACWPRRGASSKPGGGSARSKLMQSNCVNETLRFLCALKQFDIERRTHTNTTHTKRILGLDITQLPSTFLP